MTAEALIETGPAKVAGAVAAGVADAGLDPADLAWIVVTHIHLDHAGGVGDLVGPSPTPPSSSTRPAPGTWSTPSGSWPARPASTGR